MPQRPILILPRPEQIDPPKGGGGGGKLKLPLQSQQIERFAPQFDRLQEVLTRGDGIELRNDPSTLAPDRMIVFEVAGSVQDFVRAMAKIHGLEFIAEMEGEFARDNDFAVLDIRKGREGQVRTDKNVPARLYLAIPDVAALRQLVSLWQRWRQKQNFEEGFAPFKHVFAQLHDLRPWGPQDRIPPETLDYWREQVEHSPSGSVRTEVELWFHKGQSGRQQASTQLINQVAAISGTVVDQTIIPEIAYHGALIDIPQSEVETLLRGERVRLALADEVMFLRPQSLLSKPIKISPLDKASQAPVVNTANTPIAALFDGVPLQNHILLTNRLQVNDPDELEQRSVVAARAHGTAMASLIVHGDLNRQEAPISRPLYVRPIMFSDQSGGVERSDGDRLLIDTIYRAVLEMKAGDQPASPDVFLVNLSIGDTRRPFSQFVSPLARLLDFLAYRYGILFLVSAGNVHNHLSIPSYRNWTEFERASPGDRERAVIKGLHAAKHERTLLSPAEGLNVLTIGGLHYDAVDPRPSNMNAILPFESNTLPNVSSALGLGHRRSIKPEIFMPSGREHVRMQETGETLVVRPVGAGRLYGLRAAAPDSSGRASLNSEVLSDGTSSATAIATRAAHQVFDLLADRTNDGPLADVGSEFRAVIIKTLLVHGARWPDEKADMLADICGPDDRRRHVERRENISRFLGFGVPDISAVSECALNRATLIGYGALNPKEAHNYRIPLPACLEGVTDARSLIVTITWFSPIRSGDIRYRSVRLEAAPLRTPLDVIGVKRIGDQPSDVTVKRGSVFHERFYGDKAVPFVDEGDLCIRVWCKEDAGYDENEPIRYGIAVTLAAESMIPVYDEIREIVATRTRATA
jgi:Subtilase family